MKGPLLIERSRGLLRVTGRDPIRMIHGLATADIEAVTPARGVYTTFLTPKGRMVADARVFRSEAGGAGDATAPAGAGDPLLIDTAPDALAGLVTHLGRFVPPLFARSEDISDEWAVIGIYGPSADDFVRATLPEVEPGAEPDDTSGLPEDSVVRMEGGFRVRTLITGDPGWDVFVGVEARGSVLERLVGAGGRPGEPEALEALRIAAGRPRWGRELTEDVIPLEAGLLERAISQGKGCYTGQEVIVRILHRGHVNRHLRRLEFAGPLPEPGTELFEEGSEKPRGVVTSAAENEIGALGLGYVRREVETPAELRVGSPDGDPVQVTALP